MVLTIAMEWRRDDIVSELMWFPSVNRLQKTLRILGTVM